MRKTMILAAAFGAITLLSCSRSGDGGPEPLLRCLDVALEDCDSREDCREVWAGPLGRTVDDEWCVDADLPVELVACAEPAGGVAVILNLAPVGDDENCYVFSGAWAHEGTWEPCSEGSVTTPCP